MRQRRGRNLEGDLGGNSSAQVEHAVESNPDSLDESMGLQGSVARPLVCGQTQVDTPQFQSWFGESKVVDPDGRPLVVFHGTSDGGFSAFTLAGAKKSVANQGACDDGLGFFFTDDRALAEQHMNRHVDRGWWEAPKRQVYECFLAIQNPFRASETVLASQREQLLRDGYDGIIYDFGSWQEFVAFSPLQIKSAEDNCGRFDPNDPDLRA